jgi:hypothetical protein
VRLTKVGTPVSSSDGDDAQLGDDDSGTDGSGNFLGSLDSETDVALGVTNDDDGLESGSLTGTGLLLDGLDLNFVKDNLISITAPILQRFRSNFSLSPILKSSTRAEQAIEHQIGGKCDPHLHDLILQLREELVDNLELLDGQRVQVDLLHAVDLASLDETSQLGDGLPFLLLALAATATTATTTATATITTTTSTVTTTGSKTTATSTAAISHCVLWSCCLLRRGSWSDRRCAGSALMLYLLELWPS